MTVRAPTSPSAFTSVRRCWCRLPADIAPVLHHTFARTEAPSGRLGPGRCGASGAGIAQHRAAAEVFGGNASYATVSPDR